MLIAGDVGGTNTRLGLFARESSRPRPVTTREYATLRFSGFDEILASFVNDVRPASIDAAAIGVAGPIVHQRARLTNVPWDISASAIADQLRIRYARLLNDLEAMANSIPALRSDELETLQPGERNPEGNAVVIAA